MGKKKGVEEALLCWVVHSHHQNTSITGELLIRKAQNIATEMGLENFEPAHRWLSWQKA